MNKELGMFTILIKDNETYNDVMKKAAELAKRYGFDDYYITANVGAINVWEIHK